jgi:hypothetical protein
MTKPIKIPRRPMPPGWLTREQLAVRKGMSVSGIDKQTEAGLLPTPYQFRNRCILFSLDEIEEHERQAGSAKASA